MEQPDVPKALRACAPFGLDDRSAAGVIFPWPACHTHVGALCASVLAAAHLHHDGKPVGPRHRILPHPARPRGRARHADEHLTPDRNRAWPCLPPSPLPGRFWRGNLHTHSNLSDGALEPKAVVDAYKAAGYDFMQLSEHFIGNFDWPIADTRAFRSNSFTTLIGAELHAPETAVGELWHIVAAGPAARLPASNRDGETGARAGRAAPARPAPSSASRTRPGRSSPSRMAAPSPRPCRRDLQSRLRHRERPRRRLVPARPDAERRTSASPPSPPMTRISRRPTTSAAGSM